MHIKLVNKLLNSAYKIKILWHVKIIKCHRLLYFMWKKVI